MSSEAIAALHERTKHRDKPVVVRRVEELIGNTPLVKLRNIGARDAAPIYVKMESANPSGSMRDRYIAEILERAVEAGQVMPGDHVAMAGMGDSALSIALLGRQLRLHIHVFAPEDASRRLHDLVVKAGADIHWTSVEGGLSGAIDAAAAWSRQAPDRFYVDAFRRQAVRDAYRGIASEILLALRGKPLGAFITSVSTGGTFREVSPHLRQRHPSLFMGGAVLIDVDISSLKDHKRDVLKRFEIPHAFEVRDEIAQKEGLILSPKGAACVALAVELQSKLPPDQIIVALNPDTGQRYLGWEDKPLFKSQHLAKVPE